VSDHSLKNLYTQHPVTNFLNYRDFLAALFKTAKDNFQPYSYERFAADLGLSASNVLRLTISGKRKLSEASARHIASALSFSPQHRQYLMTLVRYTNARSVKAQSALFDTLVSLKTDALDHQDQRRMEYFGAWHHVVIRELLRLYPQIPNTSFIAERLYPKISHDQITKSIDLLLDLGLVVRDKATQALQARGDAPLVLPADRTAGHLSVETFHKSMIEIGAQSLYTIAKEHREINAVTLTLSAESMKELKARIRDLCQEALKLEVRDSNPDRLVQLNIQLFTLTRPEKTKGGAS